MKRRDRELTELKARLTQDDIAFKSWVIEKLYLVDEHAAWILVFKLGGALLFTIVLAILGVKG